MGALSTDRRGFLRGLASLPLVGGAITLIGSPTQAATVVTPDLMQSYKSWLHTEHRMLSWEMAGYDIERGKAMERTFIHDTPGADWHWQWVSNGYQGPAGWRGAPQPSGRAAVILSAAGVPLTGGRNDG